MKSQRIGIGLSFNSWELLQLLERRGHVNKLALPSSAAVVLKEQKEGLFIGPVNKTLIENWQKTSLFIFVGSTGAVMRLIAPLLNSKDKDPAILVIDANAAFVLPLLGGHQAGAEDLSRQIAADLGAQPVLTGDSITSGRLPLDSFGDAWGWKKSGSNKDWNQLMFKQARNEKISVVQNQGSKLWGLTKAAKKCLRSLDSGVDFVSADLVITSKSTSKISWHPSTIWIGIGCERNSSQNLLKRAIEASLEEEGLSKDSIAGIATIDIKNNEPALIKLSELENWPIRFFSNERLSRVEVPNPSSLVEEVIGTSSVAEASAILAAGNDGSLLKQKKIFHSLDNEKGAITIAIAESSTPYSPSSGELHLVGSGPGDISFLCNDARMALKRAAIWIGYKRYLNILEPLRRPDQLRIDSELTLERERCSKAIDLAMQGIRVALISSGDSGIYGMAGLALELWLKSPKHDRPRFLIHPGISALQLAASRVGTPLMNDFCVLSLSDRLNSWQKIEKRVLYAAKGDFVIAIYNPQSKGRDWQLKNVVEKLLEFRPANTPVVLARELGREDEKIRMCTLEDLPYKEVDMLTIILVGNSESLIKEGWFLVPRGYLH